MSWSLGQNEVFISDVIGEYQAIRGASGSEFVLGLRFENMDGSGRFWFSCKIALIQMNVMIGECYKTSWRRADKSVPPDKSVFDEADPPSLIRDEPQYVLVRRFSLLQGYLVKRLFSPPLPTRPSRSGIWKKERNCTLCMDMRKELKK